MLPEISAEEYDEIQLSIGTEIDVYYDREANKVVTSWPDGYLDDETLDEDSGDPKKLAKEYRKNKKRYFPIYEMPSSEAFSIMEEFVKQLPDVADKYRLEGALNGRKPFSNFRRQLNETDFLQQWYDYSDREEKNYYRKQILRSIGLDDEEE